MAIWFKSFKSRNFWDKLNSWGKPLTMQLLWKGIYWSCFWSAAFERFLFWFVIQPLWLSRSSLEMTTSHIKGFFADFFCFKKIVILGDMLDLWLQAEWRARVSCFSARFYNLLQWVWITMESFSSFYIKIAVSRNLNFIFMLVFQSKIITWRLSVCVKKHHFHNFLY